MLLLGCEKIIEKNDKLKKMNSMNIIFHRELSEKLDSDLQSMTVFRNDLQEELRIMKLKNEFEREEFEKDLLITNQRRVVEHNDEEDESISHQLRPSRTNYNESTNSNSRTGRQLAIANSTELPGHDPATTVMPKVTYRMSEILPQPHDDEEELRQRQDTLETQVDDKVSSFLRKKKIKGGSREG